MDDQNLTFSEMVAALLRKYGSRKNVAEKLGYKTVQGLYAAERVGRFSRGREALAKILLSQ